jgi:hypothetical protein
VTRLDKNPVNTRFISGTEPFDAIPAGERAAEASTELDKRTIKLVK